LIGGNASYHEAYSEIVTVVGNHTHQADINQKAQEALRDQARARYESISGVNLDEEAANMLRFQQAYQAAAQVISTADSLFQTLLSAVRG
jgi:flagellar hook-associated protein 1 FlgK